MRRASKAGKGGVRARVARRRLALFAAALALSCGSGAPEAPPSAVARFEVSLGAATDWGAAPFPSDLYRDAADVIRIGALPTPFSDEPLFAALRELFAARDGFCATCNVYFPIDGELDPTSLPPGSTEAGGASQASPRDAVVLADVDPASPERGRLFPLRVQWDPERGLLALRPVRGIALQRSRRYAAALTTSLRAADGIAVGESALFGAARDLRSVERAPDEAVARVAAAIDPALDELERIGVARASVVALAAFRTEDVTADLLGTRAAVQSGPPLALRIERVRTGAEIDDLLGLPAEDRPGIDVPPVPGTGGTRSIAHGSIAAVITGAFSAPRVVEGAGADVGLARRDSAGAIAAGPREEVPFVLTLPVAARTPLPVAIAHHGFNASRVTGFATAETAARAGVAVLAIDAFQHGERARTARDEVNAIRGVPGPDGFAETEPADVSARVFGLSGTAPGLELFTGYPLATFLQFAADVSSAVRVVREGGLDAPVSEAVAAPIGFDPQRIGYLGNSLGAVVGVSVLVMEPDVRAAVQNVQPGSIVETLAESPEFRPLVEALFLPRLGVTGPFDEVERHLLFDPITDLSRWVLEPIDPLALAPYLFRAPVHGAAPAEVLFQTAALDEVVSTLAADSMLAASGAPRVTVWDPAAHGMLEVLHQESRFEPPAVPPFRPRPAPIPVENPLAAEHGEIETFLRDFLAGP